MNGIAPLPARLRRGAFAGALGLSLILTGCHRSQPTELDKLATVEMTIGGQRFRLWVADDLKTQLRGLMHVTAEEMAPLPDGTERGMVFVFSRAVSDSFWMKNTIIPLDIAYLHGDGRVISVYTMSPLDDRSNQYPPAAPYRLAIEVNAGRLAALGITPNVRLEVPAALFKPRE